MNNKILDMLKQEKEMRLRGRLYYLTQIEFAYNSNHIEGSRLTAEQTRYIYETDTLLTDGAAATNINDIIETLNHFKMVDYMLDIAKESLSEEIIKEFHKILKSGTTDERKSWFNVGAYKILENEIGLTETSPPDKVEEKMAGLIKAYSKIKNVTLDDIIKFHSDFEKIHPFQDGNGRVGRVIMFKECLKHGITPFIISDSNKAFYYRGLKEYQSGGEKGFLTDTCLNAQDHYQVLVDKFIARDMSGQ